VPIVLGQHISAVNIIGAVSHLGLPFSNKKIIARNTEQAAVPSEFRPFRGRANPQNSVPNYFTEEKNPQNSFPHNFWMRKTSEFHSEPFWKRKNFEIPFRTNSQNRKHSKIRSTPFLGTENTQKRLLLSAAL
jgi:hypothetical protein